MAKTSGSTPKFHEVARFQKQAVFRADLRLLGWTRELPRYLASSEVDPLRYTRDFWGGPENPSDVDLRRLTNGVPHGRIIREIEKYGAQYTQHSGRRQIVLRSALASSSLPARDRPLTLRTEGRWVDRGRGLESRLGPPHKSRVDLMSIPELTIGLGSTSTSDSSQVHPRAT